MLSLPHLKASPFSASSVKLFYSLPVSALDMKFTYVHKNLFYSIKLNIQITEDLPCVKIAKKGWTWTIYAPTQGPRK